MTDSEFPPPQSDAGRAPDRHTIAYRCHRHRLRDRASPGTARRATATTVDSESII